ncbi:MAG: hypothetical protein ACP5MV_04435, partial [Candidatus Parvarchaeum sp.]
DTNALIYLVRSGNSQEVNLGVPVGTQMVMMSTWENSTGVLGEINYSHFGYATGGFTAETSLYPSFDWGDRTVANSKMYAQYVRVRAYPPNGVMPSISFGSVS